MRQKSTTPTSPSDRLVKNIRRATRKQYSAEEKIRVVLDGLRERSCECYGFSKREFDRLLGDPPAHAAQAREVQPRKRRTACV